MVGGVGDTVTCQATVWETESMNRLHDGGAIWYKPSPGVTGLAASCDQTLLPSKRYSNQDLCRSYGPPNPHCINGLSAAIEPSYVSGHWHHSCMTSHSQSNGTPYALHVFKY
ncbi:hypothetical protein AMECASPLE_000874 [Ameca splendens]|uniref:Uncharacterized protein n=1 Tax=Ameca splendens TaxID=208324 RepID=A0ABV0XXP8_9TELE